MQAVCQRMKSLNTPKKLGNSQFIEPPFVSFWELSDQIEIIKNQIFQGNSANKNGYPTPNSIPVRTTPQSTNGCMLANIDDSLMRWERATSLLKTQSIQPKSSDEHLTSKALLKNNIAIRYRPLFPWHLSSAEKFITLLRTKLPSFQLFATPTILLHQMSL